jgi:hypothetical protein
MQLLLETKSPTAVQAGYMCTCGCKPRVVHQRGGDHAGDVCCCGNVFLIGPAAEERLEVPEGFRVEVEEFESPWGEPLEAAWALGSGQHDQDHEH